MFYFRSIHWCEAGRALFSVSQKRKIASRGLSAWRAEPKLAPPQFIDDLAAGADMQLFVNVMDVIADGVDADAQLLGDVFVAVASEEPPQNALLGDRQILQRRGSRLHVLKGLHNFSCDSWRHGRATVHKFPDVFEDFRWGRLLEDVAAGSSLEALKNLVGVLVHSEDHQQKLWATFLEAANAVDAAHTRETQVHQHDVSLLNG